MSPILLTSALSFTYFFQVHVLNDHDPTECMTSRGSSLPGTFFSLSAGTWHTTRPSESAAGEKLWAIHFPQAESNNALCYLFLQPPSHMSGSFSPE